MSTDRTAELTARFPQLITERVHHWNGAFKTFVELRGGAEGFVTVKRADDHIDGGSEWFRWEHFTTLPAATVDFEERVSGEHDERHPRLDPDE
jgi:hypothetical protein